MILNASKIFFHEKKSQITRLQKLKTRVKTAVARWKSYCIAEHSLKFCCPISAMATFSCEKNILEPSVNQKTNQKKNSGTADSKHSLFNSLVNTYYRFTQQYIWLHDFFYNSKNISKSKCGHFMLNKTILLENDSLRPRMICVFSQHRFMRVPVHVIKENINL